MKRRKQENKKVDWTAKVKEEEGINHIYMKDIHERKRSIRNHEEQHHLIEIWYGQQDNDDAKTKGCRENLKLMMYRRRTWSHINPCQEENLNFFSSLYSFFFSPCLYSMSFLFHLVITSSFSLHFIHSSILSSIYFQFHHQPHFAYKTQRTDSWKVSTSELRFNAWVRG